MDYFPESPPDPTTLIAIALVAIAAVLLTFFVFKGIKRSVQFLHGKVTHAVTLGFISAIGCTAFSADSSWRFAVKMGMHDTVERSTLFCAAEVAVIALVFMARANLNGPEGTPGVAGTLIKFVVGLQVVPAFVISGNFWIGLVRAAFGPILAMFMWHLALGIDLKERKPDAVNNSMFAQLTRELRTRVFAYLGLAHRNRSALEIIMDRHLGKAVDLYAELAILGNDTGNNRFKRRRVARLHRKASRYASRGCGGDPSRRRMLAIRFAERRDASELVTMALPQVWNTSEVMHPEAHALATQTRHIVRDSVGRAAMPTVLFASQSYTGPSDQLSEEQMRAILKGKNHQQARHPHTQTAPVAYAAISQDKDASGKWGGKRFSSSDLDNGQGAKEKASDQRPEPDPEPDPPSSRQPVPAPPARQRPEPTHAPAVQPTLGKENVPAGATVFEPVQEDRGGDDAVGGERNNTDNLTQGAELSSRQKARKDRDEAREEYARSVAAGKPLKAGELAQLYGYSLRWAQQRINEVNEARKGHKQGAGNRLHVVAVK